MTASRYQRQVLVAGFGERGQRALKAARVAIVGMGALGCGIADQLVRAGVGYLRIIDPDVPELSNIQRQVLIDEDDVRARRPKAEAAFQKLSRVNSEIALERQIARLEQANARELLAGVDLVLDGTDNFEARYLINETCVALGVPWVFGGVLAAGGMSFPVLPGGPCLACALGRQPPMGAVATTAEFGVLSAIVLTIASIEVVRAIKIITDQPPKPELLIIDLWRETLRTVPVKRNPKCQACGPA